MLTKLFLRISAGILGLFIAIKIVPGVEFYGSLTNIFIAGAILGIVNSFIKPIVKIITFPIRLLTFGLFSLIINIALVWLAVDILSPVDIIGLVPLFWTTIIIWIINLTFEVYASIQKSKIDE